MWNKLERKLGRFAIPNLMLYLVGGYVIGYLLQYGSAITRTNFLSLLTLDPYYIIHKFQIWRLISWVLIPPAQNLFFAIIMIIFYYQLGSILERTWGTFRFNVYILGGILFTILGAFIMYFTYIAMGYAPMQLAGLGGYFSTYYINMTIFLAFATCFPDMEVMLFFFLPVKMKWMAIFYGVLIVMELAQTGWGGRVAILCSVLNYVIFFLSTRNYSRIDPKEIHRKNSFKRGVNRGMNNRTTQNGQSVAKHKCAVCGRTNISHPELEFRFCSKCNGNYEYCQDHLFTHIHVK